MTTRLAIVSTHPIQYNAPAFRCLASNSDLVVHVFYEWEGPGSTIDPEFGHAVKWDIPLLDGYDYTFVPNAARDRGSHRFRGIDNPSLVAQIQKWQPDVLLVYGWAYASHLRVLSAFHGKIPILFRGDSTRIDSGIRGTARRILLSWVYRHIDVALYAGSLNREYFLAHGMRDDQLVWAPHSVDNDRFSADAESKEADAKAWRSRLGIPADDIVFLLPAKLIPVKDPATLLAAFIEMMRSNEDRPAHLIFAGDGELSDSLRAASSGRSDVHFLGFQNQSSMPTVYRMADVVVLCSLSETWGLAVNEGMACSRPAIVSDGVACARDLIKPGITGYVFRRRDADDLRQTMTVFVKDPGKAVAMGKEAKKLIGAWTIDAYTSVVAAVARSRSRRAKG